MESEETRKVKLLLEFEFQEDAKTVTIKISPILANGQPGPDQSTVAILD